MVCHSARAKRQSNANIVKATFAGSWISEASYDGEKRNSANDQNKKGIKCVWIFTKSPFDQMQENACDLDGIRTSLIVESEEREDKSGPIVERDESARSRQVELAAHVRFDTIAHLPIAALNKRIVAPLLRQVDILDQTRPVQRSLHRSRYLQRSLLQCLLPAPQIRRDVGNQM